MAETTFTLGADVHCIDGCCGEVQGIVVDPVVGTVTHLAIEPKHRVGLGRLVPVELLDTAADGGLRLRCSLRDFVTLPHSEERQALPGGTVEAARADGLRPWPSFGLGGSVGLGMDMALGFEHLGDAVIVDCVPDGELALRSDLTVHATDGDVGRVRGVVVDLERHVTHVLLRSRHRLHHVDVAVPIDLIATTRDGIHLTISKRDVEYVGAVVGGT